MLNPNLQTVIQTVATSTRDSGFGAIETKTYSYQGGENWYGGPQDHKFAGFNKIVVTDASGTSITSYYHQGDASATGTGEYLDSYYKIGKRYRQETRNAVGNLFNLVVDKWDQTDSGSGSKFVNLARETTEDYDGNSTHKDHAIEYAYDSHGNVSSATDSGEVTANDDGTFTDTGSDRLVTANSYASSGPAGLQTRELVTDQSSNTVRDTKYYYDSQSFGTATLGNLTKTEKLKSGSTYINTQKAYNGYGLVTQDTDPRGKQTNYTYDSYNLYPATVTNPLSQQTQYQYDYSAGKPKQVTDPNLLITQNVFDGLDRITAEKQPDQSTSSTLVTRTSCAYTDALLGTSMLKTDYLNSATSVDTYTYLDGFGRPIQTRKHAEATNTYEISDIVYGVLGLKTKDSLPYFSTGTARTSSATDTSLFTTYSYDPLMRVATSTNAVGTTLALDDDWKTSVTDPLGHKKNLYHDAYGRLVKVEEVNGASTYTTTYAYDGNGQLTSITDALGNVRNFTYDDLGRRLTAEDLHAVGDGTYGSSSYTYDDTDNLTNLVNPRSQSINWSYDDLNRKLTEDYTGQSGTEITYTYDTCQYGKGKLCVADMTGSSSSTLQYGPTGQVTRDTRRIGTSVLQSDYTFDRQGNVLTINHPDNAVQQNTYNTAGLPERVQRKESGGSYVDVVTNFDWSPLEKPTTIAFANSATTTNAYDATKLYRLTSKTTTIPGGSKVQDLAYTYDADGNVTRIVDSSNTDSAKTMDYGYDGLNRLTGATSTGAVGGQNFAHAYSYDAIGNLLFRTDIGTLSYAGTGYANPHAVTSASSTTYAYDNSGNMTSAGTSTFTWNYKDQMTQSVTGSGTSTYGYDADGRRVKLVALGFTTYFPSEGYEVTSATHTKRVYVGDTLLATVYGQGATAVVRYDHTDHLTGTGVTTSASGTLDELLDYYPYGNLRLDEKGTGYSERKKFAGHEYDVGTGLSYMGARYYDPATGRFLSGDPAFLAVGDESLLKGKTGSNLDNYLADPQSHNSYSYARNNPIVNVDPDGNFWWYGFYNWSGYSGLRGVAMKLGEVFGGHDRAMNAIQQNQTTVNSTAGQYGVNPKLMNAIIYEEQSHLMPGEAAKDYLLPNSQLGGYDGGVGVMQVTGGTGKEFGGYSKTDLARDPTKNIDSAGRYISNIMSTENTADPSKIGTVYNGSSQYGQRIEAQINNPNYNTNIFSDAAQKIGASIQKLLKKK